MAPVGRAPGARNSAFPPSKSRLSVSDSGEGIDPRHHDKIFERFEQVDLKKSGAKVGSSGLGLAFCKMAVEVHGGNIWVESDGNGSGSTFCFSLPTGNA